MGLLERIFSIVWRHRLREVTYTESKEVDYYLDVMTGERSPQKTCIYHVPITRKEKVKHVHTIEVAKVRGWRSAIFKDGSRNYSGTFLFWWEPPYR